ncbi:MAG: flavodoxin family protein, partial [Clostridium sp.]
VRKDEEGLQTMRNIGRNMAWMLKCFEAGKQNGIMLPNSELSYATNFIRQ